MEKIYAIEGLKRPLRGFLKNPNMTGIMLLLGVILANLWANIDHVSYQETFQHKFGIADGDTSYGMSLHHWINDGFMAIFFFLIGLELKRSLLPGGELHSPRKAVTPIIAAIGGMIVPAIIYSLINPDKTSMGWGIPMATDIAFTLGILYLLGDRVPIALKVFLTTLAIIDDVGAIGVIAIFYTDNVVFLNIMIAVILILVMWLGNKIGIRNVFFYAVIGIGGVWVAFLLSGVHATIASLLAALTIPADVKISEPILIGKIRRLLNKLEHADPSRDHEILLPEQIDTLESIRKEIDKATPLLQRLEHSIHPIVTFVVLPIFALANTGVYFKDMPRIDSVATDTVFLGIFLGLLLGKSIGIFSFSYVAMKITKEKIMSYSQLVAISFLASIGFTMSLFISELAFEEQAMINTAKIAIISVSIIGGTIGYILLKNSLNEKKSSEMHVSKRENFKKWINNPKNFEWRLYKSLR